MSVLFGSWMVKTTKSTGWAEGNDDNDDSVSELKNADDVTAVVDDGPDRIGNLVFSTLVDI